MCVNSGGVARKKYGRLSETEENDERTSKGGIRE